MNRPRAVRPGATIGVFAPASPVRLSYLEAGERELERLGFRIRRARRLLGRREYTAGTAAERTADFLELLHDDRVDALFGARGGYGSLDLLPGVPAAALRDRPRVVLGASDLTALLAHVAGAGLPAFHGPMVAQQIARGPEAWDSTELLGLLGATEPGFALPWRGAEPLHAGMAEGVLRGGCLSLVAALSGTPWAQRFAGAIAVLEDTGAKPFQIERMLTQLRLSGALDGIRGIVFGQMPGCLQHPDQGYTLEELLTRLTGPLRVPVTFGFATGHVEHGRCRTVPLGVRARMDSDGLTLLDPVVR